MGNAELLADFRDKVEEFAKYRTFIERAHAQAGKFREKVIEKVVQDNTEKSLGVVEKIIPLVVDVEEVVDNLNQNKTSLLEKREAEVIVLQELELRLAIEELTPPEFEQEAGGHKAEVESIDGKTAAIDKELEDFGTVITRWRELGTKAGVLQGEG